MLRTILAGAYIIKDANCGVAKKLYDTKLKLGNRPREDSLKKEYNATMDDIEVGIFHRKIFSNMDVADKINDSL